jgi:2-polyprenyl-3-methyl-5-hydroxy-6-metoxy-1,4-benzoquinol methylase
MPRVLTPEILDSLPADHPAARRSRRDLRLTNALMGNHRWLMRELHRLARPSEAILELGAGDGAFALTATQAGLNVHALEQSCPAPAGWPADRSWHATDLRSFPHYATYPVVIGNLIFHHLPDPELRQLGAVLRRRCRVILASEPARRKASQTMFALLGPLLGADRVTLHDARVSIEAGFRGRELPGLLGLGADWDVRCQTTVLGAYRMIAVKKS